MSEPPIFFFFTSSLYEEGYKTSHIWRLLPPPPPPFPKNKSKIIFFFFFSFFLYWERYKTSPFLGVLPPPPYLLTQKIVISIDVFLFFFCCFFLTKDTYIHNLLLKKNCLCQLSEIFFLFLACSLYGEGHKSWILIFGGCREFIEEDEPSNPILALYINLIFHIKLQCVHLESMINDHIGSMSTTYSSKFWTKYTFYKTQKHMKRYFQSLHFSISSRTVCSGKMSTCRIRHLIKIFICFWLTNCTESKYFYRNVLKLPKI